MTKIKVAIVGYGNIGRYTLEAVEAAPDMECVGIVRRNPSACSGPELAAYKVVSDISEQVNNTYLKVNGQADGVKSYNRMVKLIIALFRHEYDRK